MKTKLSLSIFLQLLFLSFIFVMSSIYWTTETVYNNEQLKEVKLGFPIPFKVFDFVGDSDIKEPIFKLPADIGARHPFQETHFLLLPFLLNLLIVNLSFYFIFSSLSRKHGAYLITFFYIIILAFILYFILFKVPALGGNNFKDHPEFEAMQQPVVF